MFEGLTTQQRAEKSIAENICGFCGFPMAESPYGGRLEEIDETGKVVTPAYPTCFKHWAPPKTA